MFKHSQNNYQKNNLIIIHYENLWCMFLKSVYLQERWRQRSHKILTLHFRILLILLISIVWSQLIIWFLIFFLLIIIIQRQKQKEFKVKDFRVTVSYKAAGSMIRLLAIPTCSIEVITDMAALQKGLSPRVCTELWIIHTRPCAGHLSSKLNHNSIDVQGPYWFNWCSYTGPLQVNLYIYIRQFIKSLTWC